MVGKHTVIFDGQAGNMPQFVAQLRGIGNAARSAYQAAAPGPSGGGSISMPNLNMGNISSQINAYNRTITESGRVFHSYVMGYQADQRVLETASRTSGTGGTAFGSGRSGTYSSYGTSVKGGKAGVYASDYKADMGEMDTGVDYKRVMNLDAVNAAKRALIPLDQQLEALDKKRIISADTYNAKLNTAIMRAEELKVALARANLALVAKTTRPGDSQYAIPRGPNAGQMRQHLLVQDDEFNKVAKAFDPRTGRLVFPQVLDAKGTPQYDQARAERLMQANATQPSAKIQRALQIIRKIDPILAQIDALDAEFETVSKSGKSIARGSKSSASRFIKKREALLQAYGAEIQALETAQQIAPPIGRDLDEHLAKSKGFRRKFIQEMGIQAPYVKEAGPNATPAEQARISAARQVFAEDLKRVGVTPDSVQAVYDYDKRATRLTGTITDANGRMGQWNHTMNENGREIERNSNSLGRHRGFLGQTVKDFQKVVEWTIATTVVFGALGVAMGSMQKINQVNNDLARFAITAKTTGEETQQAFADIASIAKNTATPLAEMTEVMDDIALATRRAGQTSSEWKAAMNSMAEAVGIFTNITGVETVRATDLLSAAYKQLGIAPSQILDVLNKVTAVAGGNAKAIEEITQALGTVSEAAKSAGLSLDEQIASVQALSQVTNKSAENIATSFKNLFGSISSVGSIKTLAKFGIPVKDAQGQLRDFLDIYKDIHDAVKAGRISEGELQEVVKAIAGGPRRAPDAAALLQAIPLIFEQIGKSTGASNEALIANSRILDTNVAKLQQMRTAFDAALIETFTNSINKLVASFTELGKAFSGTFGGDNGEIVATLGSLVVMAAVTLTLLKVWTMLTGVVLSVRRAFSMFNSTAKVTGTFLDKWNNPTRITPIVPPPPVRTSVVKQPAPTRMYVPPSRPIIYTPVSRPIIPPIPTVPGTPSPLGNRAWRRSAEGIAYAAAVARGQTPLPPISPTGMNPAAVRPPTGVINPAAGLVPLRQQALAEATHRKNQLVNGAQYVKARVAQVSSYATTNLAIMASNGKAILLNEAVTRKQQLAASATFYKQRLAQQLVAGKQAIANEIKFRGQQLVGTSKGRMALGAMGGLAVGGAMYAAGNAGAADLGALSSMGQMGGLALLFSGVAPLMAAGAAITAVSTVLGMLNEKQIEAKEASARATTAVYDEIGVLKENRKVLEESTKARDEAKKTIDELGPKAKKSADEVNKLTTANNTYIESLFAMSGAQKLVNDSIERLTSATSELSDTYKEIAANARVSGFSPEALKELSTKLASEILDIKDPGSTLDINFDKNISPDSRAIVGTNLSAAQIAEGAQKGYINEPISKDDFFKYIAELSPKELINTLKDNNVGNVGGAELSADSAILINTMLKGMTEQVKSGEIAAEDFEIASNNFRKWTENLYAPVLDLQQSISANSALVEAYTALGQFQGTEAENASGRARIGDNLQQYLGSGAVEASIKSRPGWGRGRSDDFDKEVADRTAQINKMIFGEGGKGGFLGGKEGPNTTEVSVAQAQELFDIVMDLDPAFAGLAKDTENYNMAVYKYFSKNGLEIDGLKEKVKDLSQLYAEEWAAIDAQVKSGQASLYTDLLNLQARRQGGEFTTKEEKNIYAKEKAQIIAMQGAYASIGETLKKAQVDTEGFKQVLSEIPQLLGIQLTEFDQLLPALINYASVLGLNGKQTNEFARQIALLGQNMEALNKVRATFKISADATQALKTLKALYKALAVPLGRYAGKAGLEGGFGTDLTTLKKAIAELETQISLGKLLDQGGGTNWNSPAAAAASKSSASKPKPGLLDIPEEFKEDTNRTVSQLIALSIKSAKELQSKIPGETKANRNAIVAILDGTTKLKQTKGIGEEYLRRAMEELTDEIKKQNDLMLKTDQISRIRVGAGSFAAIANVPVSAMGISTGGPGQPVNVNLNVSGQILTPAQLDQLANLIAAQIKKGYA